MYYLLKYLAVNRSADVNGNGIWEWYSGILAPPSGHDYGHIKTQDERYWDAAAIVVAVFCDVFE